MYLLCCNKIKTAMAASTLSQIAEYDLSSSEFEKPGHVIVFNHMKFDEIPGIKQLEERKGSDNDVKRITEAFGQFGFDVESKDDLTKTEIIHHLNEFVSKEEYSKLGSVVIVVLTHGGKEGSLFAKDAEYNARDLWAPFIIEDSEHNGILKLFILQACRGDSYEQKNPPENSAVKTDSANGFHLPHKPNFLIAYGTVEGKVSFRNEFSGTWFIQTLTTEMMMMAGGKLDFLSVLTNVTRTVTENSIKYDKYNEEHYASQTPTFVSFLGKPITFRKELPEKKPPSFLPEIQKEHNVLEKETDDKEESLNSGHPISTEKEPSKILSRSLPEAPKDHNVPAKETGEKEESRNRISTDAFAVAEKRMEYDMIHKYRGLAYIFHDNLHEQKPQEMSEILKNLNYRPEIKEIGAEINDEILEISESDELLKNCSLIIVVYAKLDEFHMKIPTLNFPISSMWSAFSNFNCPQLAGYPKLFFFMQAPEILMDSADSSKYDVKFADHVTEHSDFLIVKAYSADTVKKVTSELEHSLDSNEDMISRMTRALQNDSNQSTELHSNIESTLRFPIFFRQKTPQEDELSMQKRSQKATIKSKRIVAEIIGNVPKAVSIFVGREKYLKDIREKIQLPKQNNVIDILITGLEGIGKTELTLQILMMLKNEFNFIIWINSEREESVKIMFQKVIKVLNNSEDLQENDRDRLVNEFYDTLCKNAKNKFLLIFDNTVHSDGDDFLNHYFLHSLLNKNSIKIIVTSQYSGWPHNHLVPLEYFSEQEAMDFLKMKLPEEKTKEELNEQFVRQNLDEEPYLDLVKLLGCLALDLEKAASYIIHKRKREKKMGKQYGIKDLLNDLKKNKNLLNKSGKIVKKCH